MSMSKLGMSLSVSTTTAIATVKSLDTRQPGWWMFDEVTVLPKQHDQITEDRTVCSIMYVGHKKTCREQITQWVFVWFPRLGSSQRCRLELCNSLLKNCKGKSTTTFPQYLLVLASVSAGNALFCITVCFAQNLNLFATAITATATTEFMAYKSNSHRKNVDFIFDFDCAIDDQLVLQ